MLETLFFVAVHMTHLSRWAEDLIIYSSGLFKFVQCSDAYATGARQQPPFHHRRLPKACLCTGRSRPRLSGCCKRTGTGDSAAGKGVLSRGVQNGWCAGGRQQHDESCHRCQGLDWAPHAQAAA